MTIIKKIALCLLIGVVCVVCAYLTLFARRAEIVFLEEEYPEMGAKRLEKHARDKHILDESPDGAIIVCGDSLMNFWLKDSPESWKRFMEPLGCSNVATAGDTIGNLRWRIHDGLFDLARPSVIVLCIGTNNISINTPDWLVMRGLRSLVHELKEKYDEPIRLVLIPPLNAKEETSMWRFREKMLSEPWGRNIYVCPLFKELQEPGQTRAADRYMADNVHLSPAGYERIAAPLSRFVESVKKSGEP